MSSPIVAIQHCETYDANELSEALEQVCKVAALPAVKDKKILLKPNILSDAAPDKAITTRPEVVRELIRMLYAQGAAEVLVGDSPGISGPNFSPKTSGIAQVCQEEGARWVEFARDPVMHTIPGTYGLKLPLPPIRNEVDLIISVAKMKTHQLMYATGSVKNIFGMIPGLHKSACHMHYPTRESFARMLAGLYAVIKPQFAIMDGIISMEGSGPAAGEPRHTGLLLASADPTALDVAQAIIMGYDPLSLPLIRELLNRKLTTWSTVDEITYPLLHANSLIIPDFKRIKLQKKTRLINALIGPLFTRYFKFRHQRHEPKPLFDPMLCIGCKRCVKICPGKALSLDDNHKAVVNYKKCIRCYCCHEVCPVDAITIENALEQSV